MWSFPLFALLPAAPPADGLILWLDAADAATLSLADGRLLEWRSKAGPAVLGADGGITLDAPPGQRPALRFDGRSVLRCLDFNRTATTWTALIVAAPEPPARGGGLLSATTADGHDYDPGLTIDLYGSGTGFDSLSIEGAGRLAGQLNQRTRRSAWGGFHLIRVERHEAEVRLYIDGAAEGARPMAPAVTRLDQLRLGARCYDQTEKHRYTGRIAQVLLYDRLLGEAEIAALEAELAVGEAERTAGEEAAAAARRDWLENRMTAPEVTARWPSPEAAGWDIAGLPLRTDLREAMVLGVRCLCSMFDADRDDEPYFYSNRRADGTGELLHSVEIGIPHVVGRCLLGVRQAEEAAGVECPAEAEAILARYLRQSFDNEDHLNSYVDAAGARYIEFHNIREGLWGLWAMIRRGDAWAGATAAAAITTLAALTDETGRWSLARAGAPGLAERCRGVSVPNAARAVEPLLALWRETGDERAHRLAGQYARAGLETMFEPDGRFAPMDRSSGHVHSITSSLSGIVEYAQVAGDAAMLESCRRIITVGVPEYFSSWGWGDEVYPDHPADEPGRGEMNQTGDVIRAVLLLGTPADYALAERWLRGMVLPTQHREPELHAFLRNVAEPRGDFERDVLERTVGGYAMQLPNDRMQAGAWPLATLDITSGTVHALAAAWRACVTGEGNAARVNLLFDHTDERLTVRSGLPLDGSVELTGRVDLEVAVRVPAGVDAITARWRGARPPVIGGYFALGRLAAGESASLTFTLPCRTERERVDGVDYRTRWLGEQIVAIEPRGTVSPLPF